MILKEKWVYYSTFLYCAGGLFVLRLMDCGGAYVQ